MSARLPVRVNASFFEDLDRQLSAERGPNGEPSSVDFQAVELIAIIDEFATGFADIPPLIRGREDYRLLIKTGMLVGAISVVGQRMTDGAIELLSLELDLNMNWGE